MFEVLFDLLKSQVFYTFSGDDDDVRLDQMRCKLSHSVANQALDPVADHSMAQFFADGNAHPVVRLVLFQAVDDKLFVGKAIFC